MINDDPLDLTALNLAALDDSALLSLRARMRAELEGLPPNSTARAALVSVYDESTQEVDNRARKAWTRRS
jgi:hypothetical protein